MVLLRSMALGIGVLSAHLAVIFSPSLMTGTRVKLDKYSTPQIISIRLDAFVAPAITDISTLAQAGFGERSAFDSPILKKTASPHETQVRAKIQVAPELEIHRWQPEKTHLGDFFVAEFLDEVAAPNVDFAEILQRALPMDFQPFLLEFWIDQYGNTSRVVCIDGGCTDEVTAALGKLPEITFRPALKDGLTVASRKLIQVDPVALL
jgi:hypothetical protein